MKVGMLGICEDQDLVVVLIEALRMADVEASPMTAKLLKMALLNEAQRHADVYRGSTDGEA